MSALLPPSAAPLYVRVANVLEAAIASGEHAANSYLPSEKELALRFGVSLITVRGAMATLVDKGLVERKRGKGTLVVGKAERAVWELGWLSELITSALSSRLEILAMENVTAPHWVARRLGLRPGDKVHFMSTVRRAVQRGGEAFMTTELYHPREIGARLKRADFHRQDAQSQLVVMTVERKCGLTVGSVRQTMSAENADRATAALLGVKAGGALLVVTRDYFSTEGQLVQTGRSRYRTENYEYVLNLARSTSRRLPEGWRAGNSQREDR